MHLQTILATVGAIGSLIAAQPISAGENGEGCDLRKAPELTRMELAREGVADKLELFKQNLQKLQNQPGGPEDKKFTVVVVRCDSLHEPVWDKRFDKINTDPPIPASFVIYTTPRLLHKYTP